MRRVTLAGDSNFHECLNAMIQTLTSNPHEHKDMFQEAIYHLLTYKPKEADNAEDTESWYVGECKLHLQNQSRKGRGVDARKRRHLACPLDDADESGDWTPEGLIAKECVLAAVSAADLVTHVSRRLPPVERWVFEALNKGFGEGEIAYELGVPRQAVAKYRKKIAVQLDLAA